MMARRGHHEASHSGRDRKADGHHTPDHQAFIRMTPRLGESRCVLEIAP
ncbi:hypothetical protein A7982_13214 [Minicystis rosea]|nr:hypothetical protein A7982_13214 [Minicystis rosea]